MPEDLPTTPLPECPKGTACPLTEELHELRARVLELQQHAQTDSLTGLYNKRFFDTSLLQEVDRTTRTGFATTLILLDVDHFKSFNDKHGHVAGDKVLEHIASLLRDNLRKLDIPCRYGGEEFALILPSTPLLVAVQVAERLRNIIASSVLNFENKTLAITASFGVDSLTLEDSTNTENFVQRVDEQLYRAKNAGRNCVQYRVATKKASHEVSLDEKNALR